MDAERTTPADDDTAMLPLFPIDAVLLPYGCMRLVVTAEPDLSLVSWCLARDGAFASVFFDENAPALAGYGCVALITSADEQPDKSLIVDVEGVARFALRGTARVADGAMTFAMFDLLKDKEPTAREDIWQDALHLLEAELGPGAAGRALECRNQGEPASFLMADLLVPDDTPAGNAFRLELLSKLSETKRLRMLRSLLRDSPPR